MMRIDDLVATIATLQRSDLEAWIREELIAPREEAGMQYFSEMDCARVHLICTLHYEMEIGLDTLSVVVSLIDQLYESRQRLRSLAAAVATQERNVQELIISAMKVDAEAETIKKR